MGPVELSTPRYQVGQRLRHPQFGEGLVVEVHTDRGREVLEVVFDGQLRRLSAQREWEVVQPRTRRRCSGPRRRHAAHLASAGRSPARLVAVGRGATRGALSNCAPRPNAGPVGPVTDHLVSLDSLRGVERFPHQMRACLKVMRDLNGRAILADEVGLGKTIEAGIVLKEYLLRGAVRTDPGAGAGVAVRAVARRAVGEVRARLRGLARAGGPVGSPSARDLVARDRAPRAPPPPGARRQLRSGGGRRGASPAQSPDARAGSS